MKNILATLICLILVLSFTTVSFAVDSKVVNVSATIPTQNTVTVTVSKVVGTVWTADTSINFGNLLFNAPTGVFLADSYYAIDVGVNSNAADWAVTHTRSSLVNGANNLDPNVNVTFTKETGTISTQFSKVTYAGSNNLAFTKTQLAGGWLRAYYGVATGDPLTDATGALPITVAKPTGVYSGTVTFTLTP